MSIPRKHARRGGLAVGVIVVAVALLNTNVFASHTFDDVPNSNPFHFDIEWAANKGIADGFDDGTFRPNQAVTRGAMTAFLHRLHGILFPKQFDRPFHVFVQCAATSRYAVVSGAGALSRGSAGTSASRQSIGTYIVTFNTNVSQCAWLVNVGTTGSGSSTTGWATVAGYAPNANALFVTTYDAPQV